MFNAILCYWSSQSFFNQLKNGIGMNLLAFVCCISTALCCRLQCGCCSYSFSLCRCLLSKWSVEVWWILLLFGGVKTWRNVTRSSVYSPYHLVCMYHNCQVNEYVLKALLLSTVLWEKDCLEQGLTTGEGSLKNCTSICKAVWQWSVFYDYSAGCLKCLEWVWSKKPYF